jgi:hypothetical protein
MEGLAGIIGDFFNSIGHKQTSRPAWTLSALPPKANKLEKPRNVRFVPLATECSAAKPRAYSITSPGWPEQDR